MEEWEFLQDAEGRWYWCCSHEGLSRKSDATFGTRTDCIANAMRHGYLEPNVGCHEEHGGLA